MINNYKIVSPISQNERNCSVIKAGKSAMSVLNVRWTFRFFSNVFADVVDM